MQRFDGIFNRLLFSFLLLLTATYLFSCDDSAVVGSEISPDDIAVNADTVLIDDISVVDSPSFSGRKEYFTAGTIEDPVFGELHATALLRPSISRDAENDSITEGAEAVLTLNTGNIYGQVDESSEFHVVEISRRWRASSWRYDSIPDLSDNIVGSFTVEGSDSITVPLSSEWSDRYREIFLREADSERDSLYLNDLPGLAIVSADNSGKLFSVRADGAHLVFLQPDEEVGNLDKRMTSWAVSLVSDVSDKENIGTALPVMNTKGRMIELDFELTEDFLGTNNFSRVELVLYEDTVGLGWNNTSLIERPWSETMRLYYLESEDLNYAIATEPNYQTNRREEDGSYRINLTSLANERLQTGSDPRKLYAVIGFNDGRVLPSLIGGPEDPDRQPKILITGISKEK